MFKKIWPRVLEYLGKLIYFSECLSKFQIETVRRGVCSNNELLIFLLDYINEERKQIAFNTQ